MNVTRWVGFGFVILAATLRISAQQAPVTPASVAHTGGNSPFATVSPNAFGTIQGNALTATNGQLADATVRLRDAQYGRLIGTQVTDRSGLFTFSDLDPGRYIVELVGNDQAVLAASEVLIVNAGESVSAVVKLPFRIPAYTNVLGNTAPNTAAVIVTQVAAMSLLAVAAVGEPTCFQ